MTDRVRAAFEQRIVILPTSALLPRKNVTEAQKNTKKFRCIASSVAEVGIIEPLIVSRMGKADEKYLLLDGHFRLAALQDLGETKVRCLIAEDDEAFTYNKRVNRLATVQEHFMILRAAEERRLGSEAREGARRRHRPDQAAEQLCFREFAPK